MNNYSLKFFLYLYLSYLRLYISRTGVDMIVIPGRHHSQRQDALELVRQYGCYVSIYFSTGKENNSKKKLQTVSVFI